MTRDAGDPAMTTLYKLTDRDGFTRAGYSNACLWGENVTHSGTGKGDLCGPGWVHAYTSPLLAVLLNPIHANIPYPRLWRAEGEIVMNDRGLKVGCRTLTTIEEMPLPVLTTEQRVRFAILCAMQVCDSPKWRLWAERWLSGQSRSTMAARAAARVAAAEPTAKRIEVAWAVARAAACGTEAAVGVDAAWASLTAPAWTAGAAANAAEYIDLIAIAERAMSETPYGAQSH